MSFGDTLTAVPGYETRNWQSCDWFTTDKHHVFHERTYTPRSPFRVMVSHYWAGTYTDLALANLDAKTYGAHVEREFYCDDQNPAWFLIFNDWGKACAYAEYMLTR
jgi:hypothetical protein